MPDYGTTRFFTNTMTSGATLTPVYDLGPEGWDQMWLDLPSFSSASDVFIHAAPTSGSTFSRLRMVTENTATAQSYDFKIPSGLSGRMVEIPGGLRYMKVELSTGQTDVALSFTVICKAGGG